MGITFGRLSTVTVNRSGNIQIIPDYKIIPVGVTPNTVTWANIQVEVVAVQQIIGIQEIITLNIAYPSIFGSVRYIINNSPPSWTNGGSLSNSIIQTWTTIASNSNFFVEPKQYVSFGYTAGNQIDPRISVTITNVSALNTVLDTFLINP